MSPPPPIPWYRIHIVTCVFMMGVGAALLWVQALYAQGEVYDSVAYRGWPLACEAFRYFGPGPDVASLAVVVNALVGVSLIAGTAFLSELLIRRVTSRLQFSLTATLVLVFAVAVLLGESYADWNMYALAKRMQLRPTLLAYYPWYLSIPIYFAIFCTLCSAGWTIVALVSRWFHRFDRPMEPRDL